MDSPGPAASDDARNADDARDRANAEDDADATEGLAITRGRRRVPPMRPPEALNSYVAPRVKRRRRSDWPVLVVALIVAGLIMAGCCIAGFALYTSKSGPFK